MTKIVHQFKGKKIMVIGDIMLDRYIWGNVDRISPEAPVPIIEVTRESKNLGAAANVANNILALQGVPILVGVIGEDEAGNNLISTMKERQMDTAGIFIDPSRPTTTKTRLVVERPHQQIARIDNEKKAPITDEIRSKIYEFVYSIGSKVDAILFEDYDKGVLSGELIKKIISAFKDKIITADPKFSNFFEYEKITLFKPNRKEVERAMGVKLDLQNTKSVVHKLRERLDCKHILLTLGEQGMLISDSDSESIIPTKAREIYDTTGAGDTVIAVVTIALATGTIAKDAAIIGNIAAGIEVSKFGTIPVTYNELLTAVEQVHL